MGNVTKLSAGTTRGRDRERVEAVASAVAQTAEMASGAESVKPAMCVL